MKKTGKSIFSIVLTLVLLACLLPAQAGRGKGRLSGVVVDEQGAPVIGAEVILEYAAEGLKESTKTNKKGEWAFIGLGTGTVRITVAADNFLVKSELVEVKQLEINPKMTLVLSEDPEKKMRLQDEASLEFLERGNQFFQQGKFEEALAAYREFAEINPDVYIINFNIGDTHREMKNPAGAAQSYEKGLAGARQADDRVLQAKALAALGELRLAEKDFPAASEYFRQSIELNPQDELLAFNVAEIFFAGNQITEAIEYYELAAKIKPGWSEPLQKIAYAWLNQGDIEKAVAYLQRFLEVDPDSEQAELVKNLLDSLKKNK